MITTRTRRRRKTNELYITITKRTTKSRKETKVQ